MSEISKLLKNNMNPQERLMAETRGLVTKWDETGLLEGIGNEAERSGMSILLENQAKQLIDEATRTGTESNSEQWSGVALPLVRRVFTEIASKEFLSVQPMNLPSGLIFYLDFKYGSAQTVQQSGSVFGGTGSKLGSTDEASGGLYGEGRFGYSLNDKSATVAVASDAFAIPADAEQNGWKAWRIDIDGNGDLQPLDSIDGTNADVSGQSLDDGNYTLHYHIITADDARGDFEDKGTVVSADDEATGTDSSGLSADIGIPEINLDLKSEPIVARTRKLKAVWTPELSQDLNAYHSIDADAELTSLLSEYVSMEIDLELLGMLEHNAATTKTFAFTAQNALTGGETLATELQRLGVTIQSVSNTIHQLTLRGGANFLVTSPQVATALESIPGYAVNTDGDQAQFAMGVTRVGNIANRFQVYKNPYMTTNTILLGFRGSNFLETGAVYAPYIPLIQTPLVYDPVNFTPRRGVMTRYAKKMVRPEFYGKITVDGLANIGAA